MKNKVTYLRLFTTLLFLTTLTAQSEPTDVICPEIRSAQDILECLKTKQPSYKAAADMRSAESDMRSAGSRWLNPELQTQSSFGKSLGSDRIEMQVALLQPIQTGGKRAAQKLNAEGSALAYNAQSRLSQGDLLRKTVISMYRFKQIESEISAIQEASDVFSKLIGQYQSRSRLLPEQDVSLSIFKLAKSDYDLKLLEAKNEEIEIIYFFKALLGIEISKYRSVLPLYTEPTSSELASFKPKAVAESSAEVLLAKSESLKALGAASLARGDAYSDITFGPMFGFNRDSGLDETLFGLALNIPFPVWNQNGHAVAAATKEANLKEANFDLTTRNIENEIMRLVNYIDSAKTTLSKLPSRESVNQKHISVEKQFFRGLVSPALMIEAHRALVDFLTQRHLTENKVTDTIWHLYIEADRANEKQIEGKK